MVYLFAQSRGSYLGLRLLAGDGSLLSTALRLLPHRTERSRRVIHVGVTRSPTDPWVAQHLREATPYGQTPKYLICDNDRKFGPCFARVATTSAIEILNTPSHAPRANAICERFLRSVRQECASPPVHPSREAARAACEIGYVASFNRARPHQGIRRTASRSAWWTSYTRS
jgi:putative transposase